MKAFLYKHYKRFLTWFGDLYFATTPPLCTSKEILRLQEILEPGMIICRGYNYYLDGAFIPGEYTHSGIVGHDGEMYHSIAEGVVKTHFIDFVKDTDRFIVLDPIWSRDETSVAIIRACLSVGDPYDFLFSDPDKFYCHEFTALCMAAAGTTVKAQTKKFGMWPLSFKRELILADDIIEACEVVYEFNPEEE